MKTWTTILFLAACFALNGQFAGDSLYQVLDQVIAEKSKYDDQKRSRISEIKENRTGLQEYYLNKSLFEEYRKFKLDSAIKYVRRNLRIASEKNSADFRDIALIELANLYSSSGRYLESDSLLKSIDRKTLSPDLLPDYYQTYSQFFEHYNAHTLDSRYVKGIEQYRDSLLGVLDRESFTFKINKAQGDMYRGQDLKAFHDLQQLLPRIESNSPEYAMVSFLLGSISQRLNRPEQAQKYLVLSALADTRSSVKDNASMQMLALMAYRSGDIDRAYRFTRSAVDDAIFCNAKFRTIGNTSFFNLINEAYQEKEQRSKKDLRNYLILISVLSFLLILAMFFVFRQMSRLAKTRKELSVSAEQLSNLNAQISNSNLTLQDRNRLLSESNHVKEEYIAIFFDLCSSYIDKIEEYRKSLLKLANARQTDQLLAKLKSNLMEERELEELYHNFDSIFLNLYPNFVEEFNRLLTQEEQIVLKPGELLNTELRIFALIRLGITDSVRIAAFLRYSLSTIYNYRTRARNKAAISREHFETAVMEIGNSAANT